MGSQAVQSTTPVPEPLNLAVESASADSMTTILDTDALLGLVEEHDALHLCGIQASQPISRRELRKTGKST